MGSGSGHASAAFPFPARPAAPAAWPCGAAATTRHVSRLRRAWRALGLWRDYRRQVLPRVHRELDRWRRRAEAIPDPGLRRQALLSIEHKAFHCEGGAALALSAPRRLDRLVPFIVALQTLSDVLDSWTDRWGSGRGADIRRLHRALLDAVVPGGTPQAYGLPPEADGGYLAELVATCRASLAALPGYGRVGGVLVRLAERYADLQVLKHRRDGPRGGALRAWWRQRADEACGLAWWEYAAAAGSTLGIFALAARAAAARPSPAVLADTLGAYVPWMGALHILLDYLVDREEDRLGGDFNLSAPYGPPERALRRLARLAVEAGRRLAALPDADVHRLVLAGLPALYLADPKARVLRRGHPEAVRALLRAAGPAAPVLHAYFCLAHRRDPGMQPPADMPAAGPERPAAGAVAQDLRHS